MSFKDQEESERKRGMNRRGTGLRRYRVVTAVAPPFVMYNSTSNSFYGYCIDLLEDIRSLVDFEYDIKESYDKHYGYLDPITHRWNGMIYELMSNTSDIAIGPMWYSGDRQRVVDFTIPFYRQTGFTIMMLKKQKSTSFLQFLSILEFQVWMGFAFAFLLSTFLIYAFERYSPFSYRNNREKYKDEPDDRFCSLKGCFWFTSTAFTPHGSGETPKNLSGKLATATWWLFGFVISAAYAANLAASEILTRLHRSIESLDDLRRQYQVDYSITANSSSYRQFYSMREAEKFFYRQWRLMTMNKSESVWGRSQYTIWDYPLEEKYTKIYEAMEAQGFLPNLKAAMQMVRKVNRTREFALIGEAADIRYIMLQNCDFEQVGDEFFKKPLAFALQRESPLKRIIDEALTKLLIQRRMDYLEKKWWDENPVRVNCPPDKEFNAGFGVENLAAVFLLIIVGLLIALIVLCVEYFQWYYLPKRRRIARVRLFMQNNSRFGLLGRN